MVTIAQVGSFKKNTRYHQFAADTFFPKMDTSIWKEVNNIFHKKDADHDYEFSFLTYVRR